MKSKSTLHARLGGFTLMEILVVMAIITVLAAIAFPIIGQVRRNSNKAAAINTMKNLGSANNNYAAQHDGELPEEDLKGKDDWAATSQVGSEKVWYNALPRVMGSKGVGDFVKDGNEVGYYTSQNVLFLPGAIYPAKKLVKPLFAIAINTKLHRNVKPEGSKSKKDATKSEVRLSSIKNPARTVMFIEQGLPNEAKAHETISKGDYDGSCKGSAKSFVARYGGKGVISFVDGHVEEVAGKDLLDSSGQIIWDSANANISSAFIWTSDPAENPNAKAGQ